MKHVSVMVAVVASLIYALIAIFFNVFSALLFMLSAEAITSSAYNIFKFTASILILISVLVGFFASIVVLFRRTDFRLIGFLTLTLSSVGLSQRFIDISVFLGKLMNRG